MEPAFTASAMKITRRLIGSGVSLCSDSASGTTTKSATSLVSSVDSAAARPIVRYASPRSE